MSQAKRAIVRGCLKRNEHVCEDVKQHKHVFSDLDPRPTDLDLAVVDPRTSILDPRTSILDLRSSDLDPRLSVLGPPYLLSFSVLLATS